MKKIITITTSSILLGLSLNVSAANWATQAAESIVEFHDLFDGGVIRCQLNGNIIEGYKASNCTNKSLNASVLLKNTEQNDPRKISFILLAKNAAECELKAEIKGERVYQGTTSSCALLPASSYQYVIRLGQ